MPGNGPDLPKAVQHPSSNKLARLHFLEIP